MVIPPSYIRILRSHFKDPYKPISVVNFIWILNLPQLKSKEISLFKGCRCWSIPQNCLCKELLRKEKMELMKCRWRDPWISPNFGFPTDRSRFLWMPPIPWKKLLPNKEFPAVVLANHSAGETDLGRNGRDGLNEEGWRFKSFIADIAS